MPDNPVTAIGKLEILHRRKESLGLQFDRLCKQPPRAGAKDIRQWIIKLVGLTKANNVDSLVHGVSLSLRGSGRLVTRLDTPLSSNRHHPVSAIAPDEAHRVSCFVETATPVWKVQGHDQTSSMSRFLEFGAVRRFRS